jgi:hypothetical protein
VGRCPSSTTGSLLGRGTKDGCRAFKQEHRCSREARSRVGRAQQGFIANFLGFNAVFQPYGTLPLQPSGFNEGSGFDGAVRGGVGRRK